MCGPRAESCLEAAGQGWYAAAGLLAFALYGAGLALVVARLAGSAPGFRRLWAVGDRRGVGVVRRPGGRRLAAGRRHRDRRRLARAAGARRARGRRARARAADRAQADPGAAALRPAPDLLRRGRLATARALVDGHERRPAAPDARSRPSGARLAPYAGPPPAARSALSATSASHLLPKESHVQFHPHQARAARAAPRRAPGRRGGRGPRPRRRRLWQLGAAAGLAVVAVVVAVAGLVLQRHAQDPRARQVDAVRRHPRAQRRAWQPEGAGDRHRVPRPPVPDLRRGVEDHAARRWSTTTCAPAR